MEGTYRITGISAVLILVLAGWWWNRQPHTPGELFRERCGACHELPDLSGYSANDIPAVIRTMRLRNGANSMISEAEVQTISEYLQKIIERK